MEDACVGGGGSRDGGYGSGGGRRVDREGERCNASEEGEERLPKGGDGCWLRGPRTRESERDEQEAREWEWN